MKTIDTNTLYAFLKGLETNARELNTYEKGWNDAIEKVREFAENVSVSEDDEFQKAFTEALNCPILTDVEQHGHAIVTKEYIDDRGQSNTVTIYGFDNDAYLVKYVNGKCVQFRRITDN